jgi:hypothetical protein
LSLLDAPETQVMHGTPPCAGPFETKFIRIGGKPACG